MPNLNTNAEEINLIECWNIIRKRGRYIIGFVVIVVVATAIYSFFMPKLYKTYSIIMPIGKSGSLGMMSGPMGGLAMLAGLTGGGDDGTKKFVVLLKSRTLAENVIDKFNLMPVLLPKSKSQDIMKTQTANSDMPTAYDDPVKRRSVIESGIDALLSCVSFTEDAKYGTIMISAEFQDPKLAADVANGYVSALQEFINENSFTASKKNRVFLGQQLEKSKKDLLEAGKELNDFYREGKVSSVESKVEVPVEVTVPGELNSMLSELSRQKTDIAALSMVKAVPQQVYLQYLTLRRNLLITINTLLTQHYEMAKIEENKEDLAFQVIDTARVPETKSKPKRKQMVELAFICSLFIGIFAAFLTEYIRKMKRSNIYGRAGDDNEEVL